LLHSGQGWILVMFVSFDLIYLSQALIITQVARFFDRSGLISFILLWEIPHAAFLHLLACEEPLCDGVEAQ
jgi:hypothetical protein